jgi:hypothetical protein
VKIHVAALEELRRKEGGDQNRMKLGFKTNKKRGFSEFHIPPPPLLNAKVLFCRFCSNLTQFFWNKLRVLVLCFS